MADSAVMIINKLSEEHEPLLTACMLHFFQVNRFFILNYKMNLLVAKNFILVFAYYYLPACNKMDITPRKRAQIVALRQHSNMTIRKIGEMLNVSKSNVGRIFKMMDTNRDVTKTKKQDQCGRKRKTTTRDDKMKLQNTFRDLRKTSEDLQRDLATAGVNVDSSTVRKRLL